MRVGVLRDVTHLVEIEHGDVRDRPLAQHTTIRHAENRRRKRRHASNGMLESDGSLFSDVQAQLAGKGTICPRVWHPLAHGYQAAVRRGHGPGLHHQRLDIVVVHVVRDDADAAPPDQVRRSIDRVLTALRCNVTQKLTLDRTVR